MRTDVDAEDGVSPTQAPPRLPQGPLRRTDTFDGPLPGLYCTLHRALPAYQMRANRLGRLTLRSRDVRPKDVLGLGGEFSRGLHPFPGGDLYPLPRTIHLMKPRGEPSPWVGETARGTTSASWRSHITGESDMRCRLLMSTSRRMYTSTARHLSP